MSIEVFSKYPIRRWTSPPSRNWGRTVVVENESYTLKLGDTTLLLRSTDGLNHKLKMDAAPGSYAGQELTLVVTEAAGVGSFTTEGLKSDVTLDGSNPSLNLVWDPNTKRWETFAGASGVNPDPLMVALAGGIRSLSEFGGISDGISDNMAALNSLMTALTAAGGGVALIPAGDFLYNGTLTIPNNVILQGLGPQSILRPRPGSGNAAINFQPGTARGEIHHLRIFGDSVSPSGIGIDYTAALFKRVTNIQVWDFEVGVRLSDGVTQFSAYNELRSFEINRCAIGLQALAFCNGCNVTSGRIFFSLDSGNGIGVDVNGARALIFESVDVEASDISLRVRGLVDLGITGGFWETGDVSRFLFDISPDAGSKISLRDITPSATNAIPLNVGLEEVCDWDIFDSYPFGGKRHHAASNVHNLIENGDFQRADGTTTIPRWSFSGSPIVAENTSDYVTAGRSYTLTQNAGPNDGMVVGGTVPDGISYVTVCVRFKKLTSGSPFFSIASGAQNANWDGSDSHLAASTDEWRIATMTVAIDPAAGGAFSITLTADQSEGGGQIRLDEVWAITGRTAGASRQHGNRIQLLQAPLEVFSITGTASNGVFGPIDLTALTGLSQPPRGAIGALVRLTGRTNVGTLGNVRASVVTPYLDIPSGTPATIVRLPITVDQVYTTMDVPVRTMSLSGGLNFPTGVGASTDYFVHLVAWILPS